MTSAITLVWFRQDLRLADNPALAAAAARGRIVPLYLLDEETPGAWGLGGAQRWWLHHSLAQLSESLAAKGAPLILRRGRALEAIPKIAKEIGATHVAWNRCYEPTALARDKALKGEILPAMGIEVDSQPGNLLREPWQIKNGAGEPFKVFTPFWRALSAALGEERPLPAPASLQGVSGPKSETLESWKLLPRKPNWASGFGGDWTPGEEGARKKLSRFFKEALGDYKEGRDRPDLPLTSRLSPHLHFGEISARQIFFAARHQAAQSGLSADKFLSEVGWREFAHGLLFHWPTLPDESWKAAFGSFPWVEDHKGLKAWQQGKTGYPLVDAGMRELWQTGWMHNRVRMIVASFLVKDLLIAWQTGARWFWDTLLDADLANNSASWQWVAGSGADAAPYFRIFNPIIQGERFDPEGNYVRRFVPELAKLPSEFIHRPWEAPAEILAGAGVKLGQTYPLPVVDHGAARTRALAALASIKQEAS